jgi:hypothetical protein
MNFCYIVSGWGVERKYPGCFPNFLPKIWESPANIPSPTGPTLEMSLEPREHLALSLQKMRDMNTSQSDLPRDGLSQVQRVRATGDRSGRAWYVPNMGGASSRSRSKKLMLTFYFSK